MFEKEKSSERYLREEFSILEGLKYINEDKFINSEDFKQGFIAGVKIMSSLLIDF